ncbi:hypothetical protein GCM10025771_00150 [Niveibacterium umoris]|uniref:Uncharacterized protein n=1 Tax=Niveibacterium umoris TaxID=1193620 RepID=A0A840BQF8_9RHOO|nr:hypothetical protein [Niveibacterium umoris]MBB4014924.1 hypothetical protein [Niveibacterium umoris]
MPGISRAAVTALVLFVSATSVAQAQWVYIGRKAVGAVRQMASEAAEGRGAGYDSATVLLAARADDVYRKALEVVKANSNYRLTRQNDKILTLELTDGTWLAGMQVTPIDEKLSQLLIVSNTPPSPQSGSSVAVAGVLRVCKEMHVECKAAPVPAAAK